MLDITALLEEIKQHPYTDLSIKTPHTGKIEFSNLKEGDKVTDATGEFKEFPGTKIAVITRENNPRFIHACQKGIIQKLHKEYDNGFVEAGVEIGILRHFLTKEEVINTILQKTLHLFLAPERAKYYFIPDIDTKVKVYGNRSVTVTDGMELFIVSRMKREVPLRYTGPNGIIYQVYFSHNQNVDVNQPLIGVCSPDQVETIEDVVSRVNHEWKEQN